MAVGRIGIAVLVVISLLIPCDSVAVEQGYANYLPLIALPVLMLALFGNPRGMIQGLRLELAFFLLTLVVGIATAATFGRGNVRFAMNEFWIWASLFAAFAASRRVIVSTKHRRSLVTLLLILIGSMALHALHQKFISNPETVRQYQLDPEASLRSAGIDAPAGSALRYQYEGRLFAAESMATYNLSTSAAVILLLGFAMSSILLVENLRIPQRFDALRWSLACLLCLCGIWTTGSRTVGLLTVGLICILLCLVFFRRLSTFVFRSIGRYAFGLACIVWLGGTVAGAILPQAPRLLSFFPISIQFRFHYWSATFAMLADHPWIGAGPGNFQSLYARYKDASMSEMIADPHNLIMESGGAAGLPGLALSVLVVCVAADVCRRSMLDSALNGSLPTGEPTTSDNADSVRSSQTNDTGVDFGMLVGAGISAGLVFSVGVLFGVTPDWEPYILGTPIVAGLLIVGSSGDWRNGVIAKAGWVGCFSVLLALAFSGGWTTPGIAIPLWCLLGCLSNMHLYAKAEATLPATPTTPANTAADALITTLRKPEQIFGSMGVLLLFALFIKTTLTPQMQLSTFQQQAVDRLQRGDTTGGIALLRQAIEMDRWDATAARQLVDVQTQLLWLRDDANARQQWLAAIQELALRDPQNPRIWQQISDAQVRVYQRWGSTSDLQSAYRSVLEALERDPTSIQLSAQAAVIAESLEMFAEASQHWQQAEELSKQNQNMESSWELLSVLPAKRTTNKDAFPEPVSVAEAWANRKTKVSVANE